MFKWLFGKKSSQRLTQKHRLELEELGTLVDELRTGINRRWKIRKERLDGIQQTFDLLKKSIEADKAKQQLEEA